MKKVLTGIGVVVLTAGVFMAGGCKKAPAENNNPPAPAADAAPAENGGGTQGDSAAQNELQQAFALKDQKRDYDGAIKIAQGILQKNPKVVPAILTIADSYRQKKEYAEAQKYLTNAAQIDPASVVPASWGGRIQADVYRNTGRTQDAINIYEAAVKTDTQDKHILAENCFNLGMVYAEQNNRQKAIEYVKRAIDTEPSAAYMKEALQQLEKPKK